MTEAGRRARAGATLSGARAGGGQAGGDDPGLRPPRPNRVTPLGDIVAIEQRGAWMGNRGILHRGTDVVRFHAAKLWIVCALEFRGWRAQQWQPGHYTVLFFVDEAVALAAGHRPCALCRRAAYDDYRAAAGVPALRAAHLDQALHAERLIPRTHQRRLHQLPWAGLPDGAVVRTDHGSALVVGDTVRPWTETGWGAPTPRARRGEATVVTPPLSLTALAAGYPVQLSI